MDTILGILLFAGIVAAYIFIKGAANKGFNKVWNKTVRKNEYNEADELVKEILVFKFKAHPFETVFSKIAEKINVQQELPTIGNAMYELGRIDNTVIYACGNKIMKKMFVVSIELKEDEAYTMAIFRFQRWTTSGDMPMHVEIIKELRKNIWSAIEAIDPDVQVTGTPTQAA